MENAKQKAKDLITKFQSEKIITFQRSSSSPIEEYELSDSEAKYCALIAVDEMLEFMDYLGWKQENKNGNIEFWQEVKQEIEKL